ncbi:MAG TPA: response regulator [Verrucomicrobiae bacterium]|jgi:CheY-like chemotaxis protein|nr:response regulator [Verrucomicrobiae bacterium]
MILGTCCHQAGVFRPRWMIVDDNDDILVSMRMAATRLSVAEIECFSSGRAALAAFTSAPHAYELVITDFDMPGMNGLELCQSLRALSPAVKVVVATGSGEFTDASAARGGFCAVLRKPFPPAALEEAIATSGAVALKRRG